MQRPSREQRIFATFHLTFQRRIILQICWEFCEIIKISAQRANFFEKFMKAPKDEQKVWKSKHN